VTTATLLSLVLLQIDVAAARPLTTQDLFAPFEYLNIETVYDRYSALIDLLIFTLIFVGIAQATLAHRYPGPGGRAVAIGVGLALAISLLLAENAWNFNLKTFGPFAAFIIVLVLGVMVFGFLRHAGASPVLAAGIAYLIVFVSAWAVAQPFFEWMNDEAPILALVTMLALVAALGGCLYEMLPHTSHATLTSSGSHAKPARGPRNEERQRALRQAWTFEKKALRPIARQTVREADTLQHSLKNVRQAIQRGLNDPASKQRILEQLGTITPQEHALRQDIHNLKELHTRVLKFDEALVHETHRDQLRALNPEEKKTLTRTLQDEISRAGIDKKIEQIETELSTRAESVGRLIEECARALEQSDSQNAKAAIERAITEEQHIRALTRQIKRLEKMLLRLIGRELWES
jgi:hypothetical protein